MSAERHDEIMETARRTLRGLLVSEHGWVPQRAEDAMRRAQAFDSSTIDAVFFKSVLRASTHWAFRTYPDPV